MASLIITGGDAPYRIDLPSYERTIACDSGYDTAKRLGLRPDDVVGDFDSTSHRDELLSLGFVPCSHDKDYSDTELALMGLPEKEEWDLIGGGGGRLDHLVALFHTFSRFSYPRFWLTGSDAIRLVEGEVDLALPIGSGISFFSLEGASVDCADLVWPLESYSLSDFTVSLSNRTTAECIHIESKGRVFVRTSLELAPFLFAHCAPWR